MTDLFAKPITEEMIKFQKWQQEENDKLAKAQVEYLAERTALMNTMSENEWEEFLQAEAIENAKARAGTTKQYELR